MGQNPTETLSEIEASRQRLQQDLDDLERRIPDGDTLKLQARAYGTVVGGSGAVAALLYALWKRRRARRSRYAEARLQAEALADVLAENHHLGVLGDEGGPRRQTHVTIEGPRRGGGRRLTDLVTLLASLAALAATVAQAVARRNG